MFLEREKMNYYSAICDYERSWSEPPLSNEEWEEEQEAKECSERHRYKKQWKYSKAQVEQT